MFKYNEKAYAEHIIKNGFGTKHLNQELTIMAKYFRDNQVKDEDIKDTLYSFCEKNMKGGFNKVTYFKNINAAVKKAVDNQEPLIVIDEIPVTEQELAIINGLNIDYEYKKILFTMMVLEKLNKEYYHLKSGKGKNNEHFFGGTAKNYKELVESSGISFSKRNKSKYIHEVIHKLNDLGLVEIKNKGSIKLNYLYDISVSQTIINVRNFEKIGQYYAMLSSQEKVKSCANCNEPIIALNNKKRYCDTCAQEAKKEQTRELAKISMRKRRNP